ALGSLERRLQPLDQAGFGGMLDHGKAVIANLVGVELNVDLAGHPDLPMALCGAFCKQHNAQNFDWGGVFLFVIASEAKQSSATHGALDCFVASLLAMTAKPTGGSARNRPRARRSTASAA